MKLLVLAIERELRISGLRRDPFTPFGGAAEDGALPDPFPAKRGGRCKG